MNIISTLDTLCYLDVISCYNYVISTVSLTKPIIIIMMINKPEVIKIRRIIESLVQNTYRAVSIYIPLNVSRYTYTLQIGGNLKAVEKQTCIGNKVITTRKTCLLLIHYKTIKVTLSVLSNIEIIL